MATEIRKVKSYTHYAEIDGHKMRLSDNLTRVFYKGRWRLIWSDKEAGTHRIDIPYATIFFEIKEYTDADRPEQFT